MVPDKGVALEQWYPSEKDRFGLAYGAEHLAWANSTASKVLNRLRQEEVNSYKNVKDFAELLISRIAEN